MTTESTFDDADFTRRRIEQACETALREAGVANVFPTPLAEVARISGITELIDISEIPAELTAARPSFLKKLLGALDFRTRTVFVDRSQADVRQTWTEAHEAAHGLLPWHEASSYLDDGDRLSPQCEEAREAEANIGAGYLIFQGHRYMERVLSYQRSIAAPLAEAASMGASMHASIRYFAERHPEPAALLIAGRYVNWSGHLPIFTAVQSTAYRQQFGRADRLVPTLTLPVDEGTEPAWLASAARRARLTSGVVSHKVTVTDLNGEKTEFTAEFFSNSHSLFVLFLPAQKVRLGKRVQLVGVN